MRIQAIPNVWEPGRGKGRPDMQRFRSKGCLTLSMLLGVLTLLICGALFLMSAPPTPPDAIAELKQLPLYPNAVAVVFSGPFTDSMSSPVFTIGKLTSAVSFGEMSFESQDEPPRVVGFYETELSRRGWQCDPASAVGSLNDRHAECSREDRNIPGLRFSGFNNPNARPPWVSVRQFLSLRTAEITAYRPHDGAATTSVTIAYDFRVLRVR